MKNRHSPIFRYTGFIFFPEVSPEEWKECSQSIVEISSAPQSRVPPQPDKDMQAISFRVSHWDSLGNKLSPSPSNRWFGWPSGHNHHEESPWDSKELGCLSLCYHQGLGAGKPNKQWQSLRMALTGVEQQISAARSELRTGNSSRMIQANIKLNKDQKTMPDIPNGGFYLEKLW